MKGLKHLGLFWQLCVERYRQLAPHERQAISEALGDALAPELVDTNRFSAAVRVVALVPVEGGGLVGWQTHRGHCLPSTVLQKDEQPVDALERLLRALGPFAFSPTVRLPAGLPQLDTQGHLVMAFRFQECVTAEALLMANRRHLMQGHPDVLVSVPPGAHYECQVHAELVQRLAEETLKSEALAIVD